MMKFNVEERKLEANVDTFIVPNMPRKFKDICTSNKTRELQYRKMLELSNIQCDIINQLMFEMWFVGEEDLESDNLVDHGFKIIKDNMMYKFKMFGFSYLPYQVLEGKKEEDIINITFPIKCDVYDLNKKGQEDYFKENQDWSFSAKITLKRKKYRYKRYGTFEKVLELLID